MTQYHKIGCAEFKERYEARKEEIKEKERQARVAVCEYFSERKTASIRRKRNKGAVQ